MPKLTLGPQHLGAPAGLGHHTLHGDVVEGAAPAWEKPALCGVNQGSRERAPGRFSLQGLNKHVHDNENHVVSEVQCALKMFNTACT